MKIGIKWEGQAYEDNEGQIQLGDGMIKEMVDSLKYYKQIEVKQMFFADIFSTTEVRFNDS